MVVKGKWVTRHRSHDDNSKLKLELDLNKIIDIYALGIHGTYWIFVIGHVIESKKAEESIKQITKQIEAGVLNLRRREAATNKKAWIKRHKIISRRNRVNGYVSSVSSSGVVRWKPERYDDSNEDSDDSDDDSD